MAKDTMANKLPRKLLQKMEIVGEQIKLARLRRDLSMAQVAERRHLLGSNALQSGEGMPHGFHRNLSSCALCTSAG